MGANSPRIVYFGTPDFAVAPLAALLEAGHEVVGVVTVPDKPAGRGKKLRASAVKAYAEEQGLPLLQPERLKDEGFLAELSALRPELGVVVAFRRLPKEVYGLPPMGFFNLHASLLPQYRGAAPINWAVINGETRSGVTTFLLNERIDEGNILLASEVPIGEEDDAGVLHDKLMEVGARLVVETVAGLASGTLKGKEQAEEEALRPAPKIFRADCRLDFGQPVVTVCNRIRGLSPYPGAWASMHREGRSPEEVKLFRPRVADAGRDAEVGSVSVGKDELLIRCADGWLSIRDIQPAGKKRMPVADYLRGLPTPPEAFS